MGLEKKESEHNGDIDAVSERMVKLELRTNENEQYHRRLCLQIDPFHNYIMPFLKERQKASN